MGQYVPSYQALDVLSEEGCLKNRGFDDNVVREDESHKILVASHVGGRRSVDVGDTNRIESKLSSEAPPNDASSCAGIDHRRS